MRRTTPTKALPAAAGDQTTEAISSTGTAEAAVNNTATRTVQKNQKADTVTAKLKDDSKSPGPAINGNLALWIALLFVSGGAAIGTTVVSRKKTTDN